MFRGGYGSQAKQEKKVKPLRVRVGDEVVIISGEGRSKTPHKVLSVLRKEGKIVVEGVNVMKDSQKQRDAGGGGMRAGINEQEFIEKPYPIAASNVALYNPQTRKPTRVKMKVQADGKRVRVAHKTGEAI